MRDISTPHPVETGFRNVPLSLSHGQRSHQDAGLHLPLRKIPDKFELHITVLEIWGHILQQYFAKVTLDQSREGFSTYQSIT